MQPYTKNIIVKCKLRPSITLSNYAEDKVYDCMYSPDNETFLVKGVGHLPPTDVRPVETKTVVYFDTVENYFIMECSGLYTKTLITNEALKQGYELVANNYTNPLILEMIKTEPKTLN